MTPSEPQPAPARDPSSQWRGLELENYLWSNRDRFTAEALAHAARSAGYTDEEIGAAANNVERRRVVEPVKARARRYVVTGYAITFLVFAVAFLRPSNTQAAYYYRGSGPIALGILGSMLVITLLLALAWVGGQHPRAERAEAALGVMLAVPFVLLILVAGLCVATTGPLIFAPAA